VDTIELKQYIIDNDKLQDILEDLGCHGIKEYSKEYRCGLPLHNSSNNIAIKKETLSVKIFKSDSEILRGDILTLIMDIKNISFPKANKYLHTLLGLEYKYIKNHTSQVEKIDPLNIFKRVKKKRFVVNNDDIEIYNEEIIKEYIPLPYIDWVKNDGILSFTCEKFKIGYSADKKRITIPWRWWCGEDKDIIGVMGRTSIKEYSILDIPKYFPLKPFFKSMTLYGLQENYKSIQNAGYVCVYEAEKSTLKRHSRKDETGVSIGSHDISDEQVKILIGLNVSVIICFDKDVSLQHIRHTCSKFYGIREIFYIYDNYDLLKEKESPADASNKIFNYLFKYKTKYDENEHREYLKELEKERNKK
jgi:DNA primase